MEIRTEYVLLVSIISVLFAIYFGLRNVNRNEKHDTQSDAISNTRIAVNLENIDKGLCDIKHDVKEIRSDVVRYNERVIVVEEHVKSAHRRIDELAKR